MKEAGKAFAEQFLRPSLAHEYPSLASLHTPPSSRLSFAISVLHDPPSDSEPLCCLLGCIRMTTLSARFEDYCKTLPIVETLSRIFLEHSSDPDGEIACEVLDTLMAAICSIRETASHADKVHDLVRSELLSAAFSVDIPVPTRLKCLETARVAMTFYKQHRYRDMIIKGLFRQLVKTVDIDPRMRGGGYMTLKSLLVHEAATLSNEDYNAGAKMVIRHFQDGSVPNERNEELCCAALAVLEAGVGYSQFLRSYVNGHLALDQLFVLLDRWRGKSVAVCTITLKILDGLTTDEDAMGTLIAAGTVEQLIATINCSDDTTLRKAGIQALANIASFAGEPIDRLIQAETINAAAEWDKKKYQLVPVGIGNLLMNIVNTANKAQTRTMISKGLFTTIAKLSNQPMSIRNCTCRTAISKCPEAKAEFVGSRCTEMLSAFNWENIM